MKEIIGPINYTLVALLFSYLIPFLMELYLTLILLLLVVIKIVKRPKVKKLPPSPWKLPVIGNIHQLARGGSLLHRTLADLARKHGPIMYLRLGHVPTIVVSSPEIAEEVLRHNDTNFSDRPYFFAAKILSYDSTGIAASHYGAYLKQLRRICTTELLSARCVQSFQSTREEEVSNMVGTISAAAREGATINLSNLIFSLAYSVISRAAFGDKCEEQDTFVSVVEETMKLSAGFSLPDLYPSSQVVEVISGLRPKFEKLHRQTDKILETIITQHRQKKMGSNLVDVLLELQAGGQLEPPLADNNIKAVILDMFIGGSESSSTVVEWAMSELLKNPKVMNKAQAEVRQRQRQGFDLNYLKAVIKETLRLHPSGPLLMPRQCREDCVISGYSIPAKAKVIINGWAIARDPKYWSEAEKFVPERFVDSSVDYKGMDFQFIPFGAGRRICPGISFAQRSIELQLANLLYHFDWKLVDGDVDMTEAFGLTVRRKHPLFLIPTLYRP